MRHFAIAVMLVALLSATGSKAESGARTPIAAASGSGATAVVPNSGGTGKKSASNERTAFVSDVCQVLELEARKRKLPEAFFARLIWQESRFNPNAVSPKGAEGIAQFMPGTSRLRGLADPFEPRGAIEASAQFLADLRDEFGNLGLAAAAYNAGRGRVQAWLSGRSSLPSETEDYVLSITGSTADDWKAADFRAPSFTLDAKSTFNAACRRLRIRLSPPRGSTATASWQPWGVHLTADWSRAKALRFYSEIQRKFSSLLAGRAPMVVSHVNYSWGTRPRYDVLLGESNRIRAQELCARLKRMGGLCLVVKN